jgi:amino acid transporter
MKSIKTCIKVILDSAMMILFLLLYRKNVISLTFHEVAGMAVLCLMLVHLLANGSWVKAVTKNLSSSSVSMRTKISWIVDFLLFLCILVMIVTALLISKKLFPLTGGHHSLTPLHFFTASIFLLLSGIHFGLHLQRIVKRFVPGNGKARRAAYAVLAAAGLCICAAGVKGISEIPYQKWISAPFVSMSAQNHPDGNTLRPFSRDAHMEQNHAQQPVHAGTVLLFFMKMLSVLMLFAIPVCVVDWIVSLRKQKLNERMNK